MSNLAAILRLVPVGGRSLDDGALPRELLAVVAGMFDTLDGRRGDLRDEMFPTLCTEDGLLEDWERIFGLPAGTADEATRRARLVAAVRRVPDLTPATIEALASRYAGIDLTLSEPSAFRCDDPDSVCDDVDDVVGGEFVFFLTGAWTEADAIGLSRKKVKAFIETIKPAHTLGILRFTGFYCDDPYSLCDTDLLEV